MRNPKKRCTICGRWYRPDKRTQRHQTCCKKASCMKKRKARANKSWRTRHPEYDKSRRLKKRDWAQKNGNYWRRYRKKHLEYCAREKQRMQANRDRAKNVANQDVMARRIDSLIDCLVWKVIVARQNGIVCLAHDKS